MSCGGSGTYEAGTFDAKADQKAICDGHDYARSLKSSLGGASSNFVDVKDDVSDIKEEYETRH